jgi:hypothetical protein
MKWQAMQTVVDNFYFGRKFVVDCLTFVSIRIYLHFLERSHVTLPTGAGIGPAGEVFA